MHVFCHLENLLSFIAFMELFCRVLPLSACLTNQPTNQQTNLLTTTWTGTLV